MCSINFYLVLLISKGKEKGVDVKMLYLLDFLLIMSVLSFAYKVNYRYRYFLDWYFYPFITNIVQELDDMRASIPVNEEIKSLYDNNSNLIMWCKNNLENKKPVFDIGDFCIDIVKIILIIWLLILKYNTILFWVFVMFECFTGNIIKYIIKTKYNDWLIIKTGRACTRIFCISELFSVIYYIYIMNDIGLLRRFFS